jgi:starch-binding outer membrane protein, SusD/RagB family
MTTLIHIRRCLGNNISCFFFCIVFLQLMIGCKKYVEVNSLTDSLLAEQVFDNDRTANSAILGIYRQFRSGIIDPITLRNSLSSDDITLYSNASSNDYLNNTLKSNNPQLPWGQLYSIIYAANSAIEGMEKSKGMSDSSRNYYIGEAKFNRAFSFFYLINLFGDVPLVLSTDVRINSLVDRTSTNQVYEQIIDDLKDAQKRLPANYNFAGGERIRATKWAATALLARVYLYQKDWVNAESLASTVINSGAYSLLNTPTGVFNKNNSEAILQWANMATETNSVASNFIFTTTPSYICTSFLINAFENGDLRKATWLKSAVVSSQTIYYPFKFTTTVTGSNEYYTVMRLAEQYLIRSEARAMQGNLTGAISDVNLIRAKHGGLATPLVTPTSQATCIDLIMKERQVDLFTEGCHRWFDLKRTGRIDSVMLIEKPNFWKSSSALYPIPLSEIQRNSRLIQNPDY